MYLLIHLLAAAVAPAFGLITRREFAVVKKESITVSTRFARRLRAILLQRCPVCLEGPMFRGRLTMNGACPVCGHRFEREQGFFQGAMYVSWTLGVGYLAVLAVLANALVVPRIGIIAAVALVVAIHVACIPALFRYSRAIWAHLNVATKS